MDTEPTAVAALSLGGNLGDVRAAFRRALSRLDANPGVKVIAQSSVWRTKPWGKTDQPDFLNMAALVETILSPRALLRACQSIEADAQRQRGERWGPRTLDIDIITFDESLIAEADLIVPHPRARERAFVLAPLAEIGPRLRLDGASVTSLLALCDLSGVTCEGPLG